MAFNRQLTAKERLAVESDMLVRTPPTKEVIFEEPVLHEDMHYFLNNYGVGYVNATPLKSHKQGDLLDVRTRIMNPQDTSESKMRKGLNMLTGIVHNLVYMKTPVGKTAAVIFTFDFGTRSRPAVRKVYIKVQRHELRRFDLTIFTMATDSYYTPSEEETCDEDPQPGCPMEEVS